MVLKKDFLVDDRVYNLLFLTETQQKVEKIDEGEGVFAINRMRKDGDKKGGGLMIVGKEDRRVELEEVKGCSHRDVLTVEGRVFGLDVRIILVYFDSSKEREGKDFDRNRDIQAQVERMIKGNKRKGLIVLGDFNGHLGLLEDRRDDINGEMVMKWLDEFDLILMNADEKCEGVYTWSRGDQRSAIDFMLVNECVYEKCKSMHVDEEKEIVSFSDHSLVTADMELREGSGKTGKGEIVERTYYRRDKEGIREVRDKVASRWEEGMGYEEMWGVLEEVQDQVLKRKVKKRDRGRRGVKEAPRKQSE